MYSIAVPFITIAVYLLLARASINKVQVSLLGLSIGLMLAEFITNVIKNAVGRPRPDLISRCKPQLGTPTDIYVGIEVCTETSHHTLQDGWRSFPSGHSSFAFAGLGYLTLFFAGQFHVFRPQNNLALVLVSLVPLAGAGYIAVSRLQDYRHGPIDVLAGSLLGFVCAYFSYRRYYPEWRSLKCDQPSVDPSDTYTLSSRDEETGHRPNVRDFDLADDQSEDEMPLTSSPRR
jgi:diacylglycerol diphosphate phosphatase/phosphatidate phosphatase